MIDRTPPSTARLAARSGRGAGLHALVLVVSSLLALPVAAADAGSPDPAPPPLFPPVSRLTVSPEGFAAWLAGTPGGVTSPPARLEVPAPPVLAAPPPPKLSTPPTVAPEAAGQPPAPATPVPNAGAVTLPPGSRATVQPPDATPRHETLRIGYDTAGSAVPEGARAKLDALAEWLVANPAIRIKVLGFANAATQSASQARWLSQARAAAVRDYLVEKGIAIDRISVLPRGDKTDEDPKDRVDIVIPPG